MAKKKRCLITFELPEAVYSSLIEESRMRGLSSRHQRAREILVEHFINHELRQLHDRVSEVDRAVAYLGELIRRTSYSVMVHAAKFPSEDANDWIREHMPRTER